MNSARAPRWERFTASPELRAEVVLPPAATPIYLTLVREWRAAGRTVPAQNELPDQRPAPWLLFPESSGRGGL